MIGTLTRKMRAADLGKLRRLEASFKAPAIEMVETPPAPGGRAILTCCSALVFGALAWSYYGRVDVVATAQGRVVPELQTKTIQPIDTSIVRTINVREGQHVEAGQVLAVLDSGEAQADADRAARQILQDELDIARIHALQAGDAGSRAAELQAVPDAPLAMVRAATARMADQAAEQAAKISSLDHQIAEKVGEVGETQAQIDQGMSLLPLLLREQSIRDQSVAYGVGNKVDQLEIHQRVVTQQQSVLVLRAHQIQNVANLKSLNDQRQQAVLNYEHGNWDDLEKASVDLTQAQDDLQKAHDKVISQTLRTPVSGSVQQLVLTTLGGVVTAGQSLMSIVPDDDRIAVDVILDNKDVGFVQSGQSAEVKTEAFSFTRYGVITGHVIRISRDAAISDHARTIDPPARQGTEADNAESPQRTEDGYIARIALDRSWVETEFGRSQLKPGMDITADIKTGRRRVISYLLGPALHAIHDGMRER